MSSKKSLDDRLSKRLPVWLAVAAALALLPGLRAPSYRAAVPLADFGRLPALGGGRIKPLDTVARTSLLELSGRQTLAGKDGSRAALEWLAEVSFDAPSADKENVFQIDDPDVLGVLDLRQGRRRLYSFNELKGDLALIQKQADEANQVRGSSRSRYQSAIISLQDKLELYQELENTLQLAGAGNIAFGYQYLEGKLLPALAEHFKHRHTDRTAMSELGQYVEQFQFLAKVAAFFPLPVRVSGQGLHWMSVGEASIDRLRTDSFHPGLIAYASMGDAWRSGDAAAFGKAVEDYRTWLAFHAPGPASWVSDEFVFNSFDPFFKASLLYLAAFLLVFASWLVYPKTLSRCAFALLAVAFVVHTAGLGTRIWLQGRPPVTNLYSSAVFVGWAAVLLGLFLERLTRRGLGTMVAAAIGAMTLVVALHLDNQGDTMEMMRAVLDSNFWLATHVTCITIGYSSTFLAGFLGVLYIAQERLAPQRLAESAATLERMVYGVVCFSTFFSFVGTILGGIWADQSWGRFWGWDPKENGALMIVLWNAAILHMLWGKMIGRRGLMVAVVFGNIVTALSWFGVNMLGIGLHSYGFMDKAFNWLVVFVAAQLLIMAAGLWPDEPDGVRP